MTEETTDPNSETADSEIHHGKWKRKKRALWKRFLLRKSTLVGIVAILVALGLLYYLLRHIDSYKPD